MPFEEKVREILELGFNGFKEEIIYDVARSIAMFHDREALQDIENCKTAFNRYMNCKGCPDCPTYEEFCMGFGCKEAYTDKASECGRNMDFSERQKIIIDRIDCEEDLLCKIVDSEESKETIKLAIKTGMGIIKCAANGLVVKE